MRSLDYSNKKFKYSVPPIYDPIKRTLLVIESGSENEENNGNSEENNNKKNTY